MFSLYNLKHHCRTCLIKLESSNGSEETNKLFSITSFPDVEHLMRVCLAQDSCDTEDADCLVNHMPNLCRLCFEKWQDFTKHYQLAVQNDRKLRQILEEEIPVKLTLDTQIKECIPNEVFIETAKINGDLCEIEKYDTISPFYRSSRLNTPSGDLQENEDNENALDCTTESDSAPPTPKLINSSDENTSIDDIKGTTHNSKKTRLQSKKCSSFRSNVCKAKGKRITPTPIKESEDDDPSNTVKTATKKAHYRCVPCKKYFYEIRKYEAHVKEVHEGAKKPFQCKECDKAYKFHKTLIDHIATNHSDKPLESYKCDTCNNMFKTQITLKTHIQNKHPESDAESRRVICDQCGFLAVNQISLKKHIKNRHTEAEELQCDECPKVFKNQYYLKYHKMNFHNPMNIKPFQCGECDMAFTRQSLLNTHKRSHLDITERIKCDFEGCDVRFLQQAEKRRHMRLVHLKVKQYICDICGAAFGTKPTLRHHRYIHTNEKPYKCGVCGQGFRQRSAMKTHSKIHIGKTLVVEKKSESSIGVVSEINVNLENILD